MACIIVAALIPPMKYFKLFVASPQPLGVIVTFFIGCCMVTGGRFPHPAGLIMILLSILVCGRHISTDTILISFPLGIFILQLLLM